MLCFCTSAIALAFQPAARAAYTQSANTFYIYGNETFHTGPTEGSGVPVDTLLPGATSGVASYLSVSGTAPDIGFGYGFFASAVQDYLSFHGLASSSGLRDGPGGGKEYFQTWATGSITETLTIPSAPVGATYGSIGQLMLGWDVTGSTSQGAAGNAYMSIFAHTSPSLPNTQSNTFAIYGGGHFDLDGGMDFYYDTPFTVTIDSSIFAAVGYDYTGDSSHGPFEDSATGDFFHTAILTSAAALDGNGNPLDGLTIITSSGLPFPLPVPEPATLALLAIGFTLRIRRRPC